MTAKPKTIDEYLATLVDEDKRSALGKLRKTIRAAAPKAEECISRSIPTYRMNGLLVGFGATAKHFAFYPFSGATVSAMKEDLASYDISKGTIQFSGGQAAAGLSDSQGGKSQDRRERSMI